MKIICVYKITSPSNRVYVGSTIDYKERKNSYMRLDCPKQRRLLASFKKYGTTKHRFEILCVCGLEDGPDSRAKMSLAQKTRLRSPHPDKTKIKMSKSAMGGRNHKAKILLNQKTGIFYECFRDAASSAGLKYNTFRSNIFKKRPSDFIVV
jgi:hypothetical protein